MVLTNQRIDMKKLLMCCLFVLCGCGYTQFHDPLRILPEPEPPKMVPLPQHHDTLAPQIRRDYYGRFSHPTYYSSYYPTVVPGYYQPPIRIIYTNRIANIQTQPYQAPQVKVPVAKAPAPKPKKDIELQGRVWQKRIYPRIRKAPTPAPK